MNRLTRLRYKNLQIICICQKKAVILHSDLECSCMRKCITLLLCCLAALTICAQVQVIKETRIEIPVKERVYSFWWGNGTIFYENGSYILYGPTNYRYSNALHTLYLGDTKESAIKSLEDLERMRNNTQAEWIIAQPNGKDVRIFHDSGFFLFSTKDVPGYTSVLHYLKTEKAIKKIAELEINPQKAK